MRVVVASESPAQREQLRPQLLGAGLECGAVDCVTFADLEARLCHAGADVVVVRIGANAATALAVIVQTTERGAAPVLAVGASADSTFVVQALRSGAREYIEETSLLAELPIALKKLRQSGVLKFKVGRTVAVTSASPGSGVTTVASNLAFALADKHPQQVVLAELGTDVPALALALDLQPRHAVDELVRDWERSDAAMIRQSLAEHAAGVQVLAHATETLTATTIEPPAMRHLALLMRTLYDWTVLDLGHSAHASAVEAMGLADDVVVVTRLDIPSLRLSRRYLKELTDRGVSAAHLRPAANFYGQRKQLDWKQAQDALGVPIAVWLPDDPGTLNEALNQGQPLVRTAKRAKLTKRFHQLAQQLNGKT